MYEQGCQTGTSVIIENLFRNVPARRKFLKKDVTESIAVTANVEKVALSHPEIAFRLIVDGNTKLETAGDGNLRSTVWAVFGKEFASRLIEVESDNDGLLVKGFIGRSDNFKANRNYQNFFINGRYVKSKTAMAALEQAYTSYMPPDKFPVCVLFLTLHPTRVDVNVHPAKLEVKFSNEKPVFEAVYYTVRTALENNSTRPSMQLDLGTRGVKRSAFAGRVSDSEVPVRDGKQESLQKRQLSYDLTGRTQPQPQVRMTAEEYRNLYSESTKKPSGAPPLPKDRDPVQIETCKNVPIVTPPEPTVPTEKIDPPIQKTTETKPPEPIEAANAFPPMPEEAPPIPAEEKPSVESAPAKTAPAQPVPEAEQTPENAPTYKDWRIVGEVFHSYVIVETDDKMLLIDKHAAHERILFEQLKAGLHQAEVVSQLLMLPVDVMLTTAEVEALKEYNGELEKIGFALRYARNTVSADAIPEGVESGAVAEMLESMAGRILNATGSVKLTRDIIFEKALYQAACKAAIKAGRAYADGHIEWLVKKLMDIPDITFCPHGRPVALELSHHTLDKQFDRMGF